MLYSVLFGRRVFREILLFAESWEALGRFGLVPRSMLDCIHRLWPFTASHQENRVRLPRWFVYHEMVLSSQVFLRGCTALKPEQILLFGGYSLDAPQQPESSNGESRMIGLTTVSTIPQC